MRALSKFLHRLSINKFKFEFYQICTDIFAHYFDVIYMMIGGKKLRSNN
jgi:hypothetical protein